MRDAALRVLPDMYATSPRCLARIPGSRGLWRSSPPTPRRLLSSLGGAGTVRHRRQARGSSRASAATTTTTLATASTDSGWGVRYYVAGVKTPETIAVLGGGLTGLTTAWYLTRVLPQAKITLYEASDRLGGWIDTEQVNVQSPDGKKGTVRFERAARMVKPQKSGRIARYDDLVFFDMVRLCCCLMLSESLLLTVIPPGSARLPTSTWPRNLSTATRLGPSPATFTTRIAWSPSLIYPRSAISFTRPSAISTGRSRSPSSKTFFPHYFSSYLVDETASIRSRYGSTRKTYRWESSSRGGSAGAAW